MMEIQLTTIPYTTLQQLIYVAEDTNWTYVCMQNNTGNVILYI